MMKKLHSTLSILATVCLMLASLAASAQNARLTGVVFDENGLLDSVFDKENEACCTTPLGKPKR